jgi:hypothetical protein
MPELRAGVHAHPAPALLLASLPPSRLASPPHRPTAPAGHHGPAPHDPTRHHRLPVPRMRQPPTRPAMVPRLQPALRPRRHRRALPTLRRASGHQRHHRPAQPAPGTHLTSPNPGRIMPEQPTRKLEQPMKNQHPAALLGTEPPQRRHRRRLQSSSWEPTPPARMKPRPQGQPSASASAAEITDPTRATSSQRPDAREDHPAAHRRSEAPPDTRDVTTS